MVCQNAKVVSKRECLRRMFKMKEAAVFLGYLSSIFKGYLKKMVAKWISGSSQRQMETKIEEC